MKLRLTGKPNSAMLIEAARRLSVSPKRAAIVEDAIAEVEAEIGGFAFVIGIDCGHNREGLERAGANLVVHDLDEITRDKPV